MKKFTAFILALMITAISFFPSFASATPSNVSIDPYSTEKSSAVYEALMNRDSGTMSQNMFNLAADAPDLARLEAPELASSSNAVMMDDGIETYSSLGDVANTIDFSGARIVFSYLDTSGNITYQTSTVWADGSFKVPKPLNMVTPITLFVILDKKSLPTPGNYYFVVDVASDIGYYYSNHFSMFNNIYNNAGEKIVPFESEFIQNSGDYQFKGLINLQYVTELRFTVDFSSSTAFDGGFTGELRVFFGRTDDTGGVQVGPSISGTELDENISNNTSQMANNTAQIAESQNQILETLHELIQHISDQLFAFWNQLAGEFTNLYWLMQSQHEEIMSALRNGIDVTLQNSFSELIQNDNRNHNEQLANDNANTEKIEDAVEKHGNFIIEGLKSLFIPSDTFFKTYFDDLYNWFSDKFGFLTIPLDFFIQLVDLFLASSPVDFELTLPGFSIMGEQVWTDQHFNLTEFLEVNFPFILSPIHWVTNIALTMAFIELCRKKYDEVMRN